MHRIFALALAVALFMGTAASSHAQWYGYGYDWGSWYSPTWVTPTATYSTSYNPWTTTISVAQPGLITSYTTPTYSGDAWPSTYSPWSWTGYRTACTSLYWYYRTC
jgi:hypothetical protein